MNKLLILAGNVEQAKHCMRLLRYSTSQCDYVSGPERIQGRRGETVLMYGSYSSREDWPVLNECLLAYEMRRITIQD